MSYSAPKQVTFLIVLLVSLFFHIVFFVVSSNRYLTEQNRTVADRIATELVSDLTMPSSINDRVSMSYIANQYAQEPQVAFIAVYNAEDNIVVSVGENEGGYQIKNEAIVSGDKALGSVVVGTKAISTAGILMGQWLFLLAMIVLHGLVWVAYTFVARPSRELRAQIEQQTRDRLLSQGLVLGSSPSLAPEPSDDKVTVNDESMAPNEKEEAVVPNTRHAGYTTQIRFEDPNQLLQALSFDHKKMYFALCDQMLSKAAEKLLEAPFLVGVSIYAIKGFDENGASVELLANNDHAKVATASMMLAQLVLMVNQIVYDRHLKQGQFALKMCTTASDTAQNNAVLGVSSRRKLPMVLMFEDAAKQELAHSGTIENLPNPLSMSERDCQIVTTLNQQAVNRLRVARDAVFIED